MTCCYDQLYEDLEHCPSSIYLVDPDATRYPTPFLVLLLHLVHPAFLHALLDTGRVVEGPALTDVGLADIFTGVAAAKRISMTNKAAAHFTEPGDVA